MRAYRLEELLPADRGSYRFELLEDGERIALFREARHAQIALDAVVKEESSRWPSKTSI